VDKELEFEWDESKARINLEKHGVSFFTAAAIFRSVRIERIDDREDYGEVRWIALGRAGLEVYRVVYTWRGENRILSSAPRKRIEMSRKPTIARYTLSQIEALRERGLRLYLASGTDQAYMREEAALLDVARYFEGRVYGALDDYQSFSKKILIERLIASSEFDGAEFLGFGDGYVEIENIKEVGGVAVGVATAEPACRTVDEWKRRRLLGAGADFIIPNFLCRDELLASLFPNGQ